MKSRALRVRVQCTAMIGVDDVDNRILARVLRNGSLLPRLSSVPFRMVLGLRYAGERDGGE